jgi:cytidyltransferase-like protein
MKVGVFLARFQPIHNGHLDMIKTMLEQNDMVLIIIGSIDKINHRNPIPYMIRFDLVKSAIKDCGFDEKKIKYLLLNDLSDEQDNSIEWGFYLYANIVKQIYQPFFTLYYSDGCENIIKWFPEWLRTDFVSLNLRARNTCLQGLSATKVRYMIKNDLDDTTFVQGVDTITKIEDMVPKCVLNIRYKIQSYL